MLNPHQKIRFKKMVKLAEIKVSDKILDIGCWDKELKQYIIREKMIREYLNPNVQYVGIDKEHNPDYFCDIEKGLSEYIIREKFDIIFLGEVIEHIENHKSLLKDCEKCLSKNGRIILSTPLAWRIQWKTDTDHIHSFTPLNLRVLADQCGLRITKMIGSFIPLLIFNLRLNVNWTFYTNNLIIKMVRK